MYVCVCVCLMHMCVCVSRVLEQYYCKHIIWWGEWFRLLAGCPAFIWNRAANIWTVSTLTDSVCVCVYWGPCLGPRAVSHWMGNRSAQINQRCSINKRSPISPCLQAAILRAWESSLASSRSSFSHTQAMQRHAGTYAQPGMGVQPKYNLTKNVNTWKVKMIFPLFCGLFVRSHAVRWSNSAVFPLDGMLYLIL